MKKHQRIIKKMFMILAIVIGALVVLTALGFANIGLQIPRYHHYWQKLAEKPKTTGALIYVALGDSTAQGIGASSPANGYVGLLAKRIESKTGRPVHVINMSKSGARSKDALEDQLPKLLQLKPDIVTIEIGANDLHIWDATAFRDHLDQLFATLPEHTVISDVPYFGGGRHRSRNQKAEEANKILGELAQKYNRKVAPLYSVTKERDSWLNYSTDYFHPSNRGYQNWADAFWQLLEPQL
jgi:acyl-CoA thioesterase I